MIFLGVAGGGPGEDGPTSVASYSAGGDDDWIEMDSSVHSSYDSANSSSTAVVTTEDENQSPTNKLPVVDSVVSTTDVISAGSEMAAVAVTAHSLDALLAQELNALTFQERQGIDEEIHGVHSSSVDETPDFVKEKLSALEREVQKIRNKDAYDRAVQLNSSYIRDADNFLLPFLRAEFFREEEAAKRMVKFLTFMVDLYGEVALTRPMYLSDMNAEDMKFMKVGAFQVLPGRDRSGRRIYGLFDDIPPETPIKSRIRVSLSTFMAAGEDVETQKKGVVGIIYQMNPRALLLTDHIERAYCLRMLECMPLRLAAVHLCLADHPISHSVKAVVLMSVGTDRRTRTRFHTGSDTECLYSLQSFGINADSIPINTNSGTRKTKNHLKWLELRQIKEGAIRSGNTFDGIDCPDLKDVLFGRGRPIMRHPGNVVLRDMLESRLEEYNAAKTKKEKTEIAWEIVRQLKGWSCRFLREDSRGWWVEVSDDVARQKVSIGFRDVRKTKDDDQPVGTGGVVGPSYTNVTVDGTVLGLEGRQEKKRTTVTGNGQTEDSSTSVFLSLDGRGKKQRLCQAFNLCSM